MTEPAESFTTNREDVAAKVIDGELIIIRLSDGTYYSMENVGTAVWELIDAGADLDALAREIAARYGAPVAEVQVDVVELLRQLIDERLVISRGNGVSAPWPAAAPQSTAATPPTTAAYRKPELNIYRDMGNLLALDPPTPGIDDLAYGEPGIL